MNQDRSGFLADPDPDGRKKVRSSFGKKSRSETMAASRVLKAGAAATRSRGIWLEIEPEPSLWPGSGSGSGSCLNFSLIIHANCMVPLLISFLE